jgi:hypothetical protein
MLPRGQYRLVPHASRLAPDPLRARTPSMPCASHRAPPAPRAALPCARVNESSFGQQQVDEHMLQPYVSSSYCKSRSGIAYVAMAIHLCCKYMFQMFQLFQTYVVSVLSICCICCSGYTHMLQVCFLNVLCLSECCMFLSVCCICCSGHTRML